MKNKKLQSGDLVQVSRAPSSLKELDYYPKFGVYMSKSVHSYPDHEILDILVDGEVSAYSSFLIKKI
jgi:hypothetical protein